MMARRNPSDAYAANAMAANLGLSYKNASRKSLNANVPPLSSEPTNTTSGSMEYRICRTLFAIRFGGTRVSIAIERSPKPEKENGTYPLGVDFAGSENLG